MTFGGQGILLSVRNAYRICAWKAAKIRTCGAINIHANEIVASRKAVDWGDGYSCVIFSNSEWSSQPEHVMRQERWDAMCASCIWKGKNADQRKNETYGYKITNTIHADKNK
jgi:hypothetical protein